MTTTCPNCRVACATIRHQVEVAADHTGEHGETVCLWPCGHEVDPAPTQCSCTPVDLTDAVF